MTLKFVLWITGLENGEGAEHYILPSVWLVLVSMSEGEVVVGYIVAGEAGEGELSLEPE